MNTRNNIKNELVELDSALPADMHKPVFGLPEGYFENFAASLLQKIKEEEALSATDELSRLSPLLASVSKKTPYHVPQNYFSTLSEDLPLIVSEEALPSMLMNADRTVPYSVPAGYFDGFAQTMLQKVAPKEAKVVPMRSRWMRMAAAAIIAGVITIGSFLYVGQQETPSATGENWVASTLQNVSDKELEEFVNGTEVGSNGTSQPGGSSTNVSGLLSDVSTKEMDAFLAQVPSDDELLIIN